MELGSSCPGLTRDTLVPIASLLCCVVDAMIGSSVGLSESTGPVSGLPDLFLLSPGKGR